MSELLTVTAFISG